MTRSVPTSQQPQQEHTASAEVAPSDRIATIRTLNDNLRRGMIPGRVMITVGVAALSNADRLALIRAIQTFDAFTPENDPYGEHDFGSVELLGTVFFWKIDYYDTDLMNGSPDPADTTVTRGVLTIMCAEEY